MGKKWEIISKSAAATVCSGKIVGEGQVGKDILLKLFSWKERIKKIRAKKKWKRIFTQTKWQRKTYIVEIIGRTCFKWKYHSLKRYFEKRRKKMYEKKETKVQWGEGHEKNRYRKRKIHFPIILFLLKFGFSTI